MKACPRRVISIHYGHSNPLYTYNASTATKPIAGKDVYTLLYYIRKVGSQKYKINCVTSFVALPLYMVSKVAKFGRTDR